MWRHRPIGILHEHPVRLAEAPRVAVVVAVLAFLGVRPLRLRLPPPLAYSISGVGDGVAVLHANRLVQLTDAESWNTSVDVRGADGKRAWSVGLPWSVRQPPIDGGNGRVHAAGDELAALEGGKVV